MAEKGAVASTFELTPELRSSLGLRDREYVVRDPVEIVVETKGGGRLKPPQEIRERIVRCRDCFFAEADGKLCKHFLDECDDGPALVDPDGFCSWGEERGERWTSR